MPHIPFSRFVVSAVASELADDGIRVFPQPIPCRLSEDNMYRPLVMNTSGKFLARVAANRAGLQRIKIRSIAQPEELPQAKLDKVVIGPNCWATILRTRNNHQEIWTKHIPTSLLDQVRLVYEENMEVQDIAIGANSAWFLHAVRMNEPSLGHHFFFGGEICDLPEFRRIISAASSVQKVQFAGDGWLIRHDENSFSWRNLPDKLSNRLEEILCSDHLTINQVVCCLDEDAWYLSFTDRVTQARSACYGDVSELFVNDTRKLWASEIFLGPNQFHFIREHDRTLFGHVADQDLVNFLR